MYEYIVFRKSGRRHTIQLDDDSPARWKSICANDSKKATYFYVQQEGKLVGLARYVKQASANMHVVHIDRNPANNQKANLRLVTQQQNNFNVGLRCHNTTGLINVHRYPSNGKNLKPFFAKIVQGKLQHTT